MKPRPYLRKVLRVPHHKAEATAEGREITVGQLKRTLKLLCVPDDAKIRFAAGRPESKPWAMLKSVSFYRDGNEVSLW